MWSGSHGERDGAGGGCDRERRALPERCQRAASQIHQRVGPRAADHHVAAGGREDQRLSSYTNSTDTQTVPEREGRTEGWRKEEERGGKREQQGVIIWTI